MWKRSLVDGKDNDQRITEYSTVKQKHYVKTLSAHSQVRLLTRIGANVFHKGISNVDF